ncbi:MAG: Glucose-1-phosphate adenylyltransferase [Candidatus Celerinatantimonas neptuna]|nr:MAG: Glucose-1-phosphate adenylyltransferase [Candidatus Celerinatantimonas neptuna]
MLEQTIAVILAGGVGSRLHPLTQDRAKPAVPFGGKYRIIDFTLANCLHSGLRRILVLTQYKSHSLHKHLRDGWSIFNPELNEYIISVPPQMREGENWYRGTADSMYQNLFLLERSNIKYVVILSGDHIYRMDYVPMLNQHIQTGAELTIACMSIPINEAFRFGIMSVDESRHIRSFVEKPEHADPIPGHPDQALASMGIYVFSVDCLKRSLEENISNPNTRHDFGSDVIPGLIQKEEVYAYPFGGKEGRVSRDHYWRDVGTIDSYYQANMDLLQTVPPINLYQQDWYIRSYQKPVAPAKMVSGASGTEGITINSIIGGGVIVSGGCVQNSIIFQDARILDTAIVENSLIFDHVVINPGCHIRNCIIDKHVTLPPKTQVGINREEDEKRFVISEQGIVVIPKGYQFNSATH